MCRLFDHRCERRGAFWKLRVVVGRVEREEELGVGFRNGLLSVSSEWSRLSCIWQDALGYPRLDF